MGFFFYINQNQRSMMNWEQLLSLKRFGDLQKRPRAKQDETRLGFEVDFDRIIFSEAFRSLQDKTQVIPLSETDFVHTRLTHSLEVSVVGRTLGRRVGKVLLERHPNLKELGYTFNDFGAIVAAASVMHDIGNPPFGHSGEKAIGEYFKTGNGTQYKEVLSAEEYQDLIDFEGNANGLKILTENREGVYGGLRLSYAADDICYTIIDFEDGINLGLIEEEFALEYLIKLVKNTIDIKKYHSLKFKKDRVSYLRALAINTLINEAVAIFLTNEEAILKGTFSTSLLDKCAYEAQINDILKISISKIYKSQEVIEKEVAGYKIIADLLDIFVTALNNHHLGTPTNYDSLLLNLLPKEFQVSSTSPYQRIMAVCSYVSRMSDGYAIRIHKKIQGSII